MVGSYQWRNYFTLKGDESLNKTKNQNHLKNSFSPPSLLHRSWLIFSKTGLCCYSNNILLWVGFSAGNTFSEVCSTSFGGHKQEGSLPPQPWFSSASWLDWAPKMFTRKLPPQTNQQLENPEHQKLSAPKFFYLGTEMQRFSSVVPPCTGGEDSWWVIPHFLWNIWAWSKTLQGSLLPPWSVFKSFLYGHFWPFETYPETWEICK